MQCVLILLIDYQGCSALNKPKSKHQPRTGWLTWSPIELSLIAKKEKVEVKSKPSTRSRLINCSNACTPSLLGPLHKTRWSGKEKNRQQKRTEKTQEDTRRGISEKTREHEHVESWTTTMPMHLSWRKPINSKKKRKENEEKGQKKKAKIKIKAAESLSL